MFWKKQGSSAVYESKQCLHGKGCKTVQNISSFEEAEFRNIVFDGNSYFVYSHNDYCDSAPKWIQAKPSLKIRMADNIFLI